MNLLIQLHRNAAYSTILQRQLDDLQAIAKDKTLPNMIHIVEHEPVITMGRSFDAKHLLYSEEYLRSQGIDLCQASRGGDITYHGTGQWTVYPILRMGTDCVQRDLHQYMRQLESVVIEYLYMHHVKAFRIFDKTGVFVNHHDKPHKIAAIGIAVRKWISFHGFAINIQNSLTPQRCYMTPCGISPDEAGVTSLAECAGNVYDMVTEARKILESFFIVFGLK